jgi:hypothetical protein
MNEICKSFPIGEEEYALLHKKFGDLNHYIAWQLYKKNSRNNHTDEQEDIAQELTIALIRAGSYYKRQVYIEKSLDLCHRFVKDEFLKIIVLELKDLWANKTRHGASRQKFGPYQEKILNKILKKLVPVNKRPSKKAPLEIDGKFTTYCKAITWNAQKSMGKKITREKGIRAAMVSLSEFDYLSSTKLSTRTL